VYFCQVGIRVGLQNLIKAGVRYGFTSETGIDLPNERESEFPTGVAWYKKRFGTEPTPSEVMSLSIGQGPNGQTVLRMAYFYSAIAGNGTAPEPHLVVRPGTGQQEEGIRINLSEEGLRALWAGLARVTGYWGPNDYGTAVQPGLERWQLYGKTGTVQNPHGPDHGWFAGFAGPPGARPQIAIAVLVEHGLHGSDVAPIAAKAADFYLRRKYNLPSDPKPLLIERWQSGRCPWSSTCTVADSASAVSPITPRFGPGGKHLNPVGIAPPLRAP
jgi:penicillin-binding protein 2